MSEPAVEVESASLAAERHQRPDLFVFKIGGSLHAHPQLRSWLDQIATHGGGRAIIVPGGGPYADLVRAAQSTQRFSDADAHLMAMRAMDQFGRVLLSLEPRLAFAGSEAELHELLVRGRAVICSAQGITAGDASIEASWEVTSDSLAIRIAHVAGAASLVLIKSVAPSAERYSASVLVEDDIVDRQFPAYLNRMPLCVWWSGPDNPVLVNDVLTAPRLPAGDLVTALTQTTIDELNRGCVR